MTHYRIILLGFGNVGQAFARLLLEKRALLRARYQLSFQVNGIVTGRHGSALDVRGLDLAAALECAAKGEDLSRLSVDTAPADPLAFIRACPGDILFENTPVNHLSGQPATGYLWTALECGMHAITANKGPVVHGLRELEALAARMGKRFLYESAVMDGAPIFSLFRSALPALELDGFEGVLNSTTNLILEEMERGRSFDEAVRVCQEAGLAETDPAADIDGWDAAIKVCALANVLMGADLRPAEIAREGIRGISAQKIAEARQAGQRWKLICRAERAGMAVHGSVRPELVGPDSRWYAIGGSSSGVEFRSDVLPGLGIIEGDPGPQTTAYGLLADMINAGRGG